MHSQRSRGWLIAIKTVGFLLLYVAVVAFVIPGLLIWWADDRWPLGLGRAQYAGVVSVVAGLILYLYCTTRIAIEGKGMPAPLDPTRELVVSGLYAIVRNPMYLAAVLFFWGEVIFFNSGVLLVYAALITLAYHVGVLWFEEPALSRRFGASYEAYCTRVPRWLPSIQALRR
jgi:protein-S-isoprenylcysteine O-methyltransferase Ste14